MTTYNPKPTIFQTCMVLLALTYWPLQGTAQVSTNVTYRFLHDGITKSGYSHGELVYDEVIQGADGNFYGTTTLGGSGLCAGPFGIQGCGTVYKYAGRCKP